MAHAPETEAAELAGGMLVAAVDDVSPCPAPSRVS